MKFGKRMAVFVSFVVIVSVLIGTLLAGAAPEEVGGGVIDYEARIAELEAEVEDLTILAGTNRELLDFLEDQWIPGPQGEPGPEGPPGPQGDPGAGFLTEGTISISAGEFIPTENRAYENLGWHLVNYDPSFSHFVAGVQLPQGALISEVTLIYSDYGEADIILDLYKVDNDALHTSILTLQTSGQGGLGEITETPTGAHYVDNDEYSYCLILYLPYINYNLHKVLIEYDLTA